MKKIIIFILSFLILTVVSVDSGFKTTKIVSAQSGTAEVVMELNSGRVLHAVNAHDKKYMASTTKILTAIVVIENCDLNDVVTVTKQTIGVEGSSIYLEEGEKLSVRDLLYGLMLRSGNDCAETLAVHCCGSIEDFASLMNETANKIGATNSNFVNPHGLHNDNHYTSAYDLALISRYAMKNEDFRNIVSTKSVKIPHTTQNYDRYLKNKNKMLNEFDGSNGIKTGYTKKAGRCLVSSCLRGDMELICVVLNCPPMFERSKTLLTQSFSEYKNYKVLESDNIIGFAKKKNSDESCALYVKNDVILPLTDDEYKNINIVYEYPEYIEKINYYEKEIGVVKFYSENNLLFEEKIYTILKVE